MKIRNLALSLAACAAAAVTVQAQETVVTSSAAVAPATTESTTTTTTNTAGTIEEFTPASSRIIVRSSSGPVSYTYSKRTTFVDDAGNVVSSETIRPGIPTTVYYATEAGQPVVSRVVVHRRSEVVAPTTSTTVVEPAAPVTHTERTETTTTTTGKK